MNLHYSQTYLISGTPNIQFYYLMNLHYSQTLSRHVYDSYGVLLPYEFTLLSNVMMLIKIGFIVLLPYEFTLLSNMFLNMIILILVLLPYEFTLLSNRFHNFSKKLEFYYLMNLHYSQTLSLKRLIQK